MALSRGQSCSDIDVGFGWRQPTRAPAARSSLGVRPVLTATLTPAVAAFEQRLPPPNDRNGSFPAVPARQRRGRSTSISGPPPREPERAYLAIRHPLGG
jgi:hypothetical protein